MTEETRTIGVVGDRFREFAVVSGTWTLSELVAAVDSGALHARGASLTVRVGQGIGDHEIRRIIDALTRLGSDPDRVDIQRDAGVVVERGLLHKGEENNVLLRDLAAEDANTYTARLRLHHDNELIVDLQDRAHVQGMVAIEASRQMFVAVAERFYLAGWSTEPHYLVVNEMNTSFRNFLFPTEALVRLRVQRTDVSEAGYFSSTVSVEVEQAGRVATSTEIDYAALPESVLAAKEEKRAQRALTALLADGDRAI